MFNEIIDYVTRHVRPFMDLLSFKGQLVDPNAVNDNARDEFGIVPPEAVA